MSGMPLSGASYAEIGTQQIYSLYLIAIPVG